MIKESKKELPAKKVHNAAQTRKKILEAAKKQFFENSYENVALRKIAAASEIDVAMVNRYFGSKENLFKEVLSSVLKEKKNIIPINPQKVGQSIAEYIVSELWKKEPEKNFYLFQLLLKSATSPIAAPIIAQIFHEESIIPFSILLNSENSELKVGIISSYILGLITVVTALKSPTISPEHHSKIVGILGKAIQDCIDS